MTRSRRGCPPAPLRLLVLAALVLAGCATRPLAPLPSVEAWPEQRAALQALQRYELHGRVAVLAGSEGFNGALHWEQDREHSQIHIDGPLGAGALSLESDGSRLALATSRGERLDGDAARAELERRLGFALPLASLRYWLLGAPGPASPATELPGPEGRLAGLEQDGWHVAYGAYAPSGASWLPKRITIERGDARVRLIVDRWELAR